MINDNDVQDMYCTECCDYTDHLDGMCLVCNPLDGEECDMKELDFSDNLYDRW